MRDSSCQRMRIESEGRHIDNVTFVLMHRPTQLCAMKSNLALKTTLSSNLWDSSSHPIVFVERWVVGKPDASPSVQLSRNAKTLVAAILTVEAVDAVPTIR